jgi:hypothetical protein
VASLALQALGAETRSKLPLALVEAVLVGLYVHRDQLDSMLPDQVRHSYVTLKARPNFAESARYAVSSVDNVRARLNDAINVFR